MSTKLWEVYDHYADSDYVYCHAIAENADEAVQHAIELSGYADMEATETTADEMRCFVSNGETDEPVANGAGLTLYQWAMRLQDEAKRREELLAHPSLFEMEPAAPSRNNGGEMLVRGKVR